MAHKPSLQLVPDTNLAGLSLRIKGIN